MSSIYHSYCSKIAYATNQSNYCFKGIRNDEVSRGISLLDSVLFLQLISFIKYQLVRMKERKVWNSHEDQILRMLKQERGQKKWSVIARKMEEEFQIPGRTGKQCRERYHNHLDSSIISTEWKEQEDKLLATLHQTYGNKWSSIAQNISGRSDNCVKNRFYSKLRKSLRKLNKFIAEHLPQTYEPIASKLLSKIIETTELRFQNSCKIDEDAIQYSIDLKNRLFNFEHWETDDLLEGEQAEAAQELVEDIIQFGKNMKKPGRTIRRRTNSFDQKELFLHPRACLKKNKSNCSNYSEVSEDLSLSSNLSSCDQFDQIKPRQRSQTTRSSKDFCSRNCSDIVVEKNSQSAKSVNEETKLNSKQTQCELNDPTFHWVELNQKLSMSLIEQYPHHDERRQRQRSSISSKRSNSNNSNKSNRFKSFDDFCSLNQRFLCHFNLEDPVAEIVWRVLQPQSKQKQSEAMEEEEDIIPHFGSQQE